MDAPFGIIFLRKAELYSLLKDQANKAIVMKNKHRNSPNPITWYVEKAILKWTYHGHKYLYATINTSDFNLEKSNKLKDWELCDNNGIIKNTYDKHTRDSIEMSIKQPNSVLSNIVARGFGEFLDNNLQDKIIINKEGLLLGEVIYNVEEKDSHLIYYIYSFLMDYGGAWVLLLLVFLTIIMTVIVNIINISLTIVTVILTLILDIF